MTKTLKRNRIRMKLEVRRDGRVAEAQWRREGEGRGECERERRVTRRGKEGQGKREEYHTGPYSPLWAK